jgi:hypothetical protein
MTVKKESPDRQDDGYMPLDSRVLHTVRKGLYWAKNMKTLFQTMDRADNSTEVAFERNRELEARDAGNAMWRHYKESFIDLGG